MTVNDGFFFGIGFVLALAMCAGGFVTIAAMIGALRWMFGL